MNVHLSLAGAWVPCEAYERACPRIFHLPGMTPTEATALPTAFLWQLMEAADPPTIVESDGTKRWHRDGTATVLHRGHDLPAYVTPDSVAWYTLGKRHRDGGKPAFISGNRHAWVQKDLIHRDDDLPAVVDSGLGEYEWYVKGQRHRDGDRPAFVSPQKIAWYKHDKLHRDGNLPAVIFANGRREWCRQGRMLSFTNVGTKPERQATQMARQFILANEPASRDANGRPVT